MHPPNAPPRGCIWAFSLPKCTPRGVHSGGALPFYIRCILYYHICMKKIRVVAAIIRKDDKILATQRGYGEFKDWWEFPGGKIEPGETPEQALVRELKEEMAADIVVGEYLMTVEYDYPDFHLSMDCYWAALAEGSSMTLLEHEAARWLAPDELDMVRWLPADVGIVDKILGR